MPTIPKLPRTPTEYKNIVDYLKSKKIPKTIYDLMAKCKFEGRCKKFELDENEILYLSAVFKNGEMVSDRRCIIPKYDVELRVLLLKNFHGQSNHRNYHKTFSALSEKHIGVMQTEVQAYINECSVCVINSSIKERTDMKSVTSMTPWRHIQIDLIDFHDFKNVNYGFVWLLTCVCTFSKYLVAILIKNKEADETPNKDQDNEMSVYEISDNDQDNEMSDDEMSEESNRDASETFTPNNVIEQHVLRVSKIHESVNITLGKYYTKMCQQGSVHKKKMANNTIEAGTMINIAPDHDTNPQTRKRKLQLTFSQQGTFIRLTSNNHTAIVEIDGKETPVPIK
ncbi:2575_t:CDS:2 [Cetraspora pellucida]|uniref:2575_t:CDS:1 n=1 Tax=Cetraspora pellucida TaxID=1433469 RepID=A0ACA9K5Q6_9GLOM|nr:2575_t:CDS:2 [Cetraspora pellucida]